jgi:CRP-like cAMP-binding protein
VCHDDDVNPAPAHDPPSALAAAGAERHFRPGQVLFHAGDPSDHVLFIRDGRVKIVAASDTGAEAVLAVRGPGDFVGELSGIDGRVRSATAVALEELRATMLTATAFRRLLTTEPGLAFALLEVLAGRLREADRDRVEYGSKQTLPRVAARLVELAGSYGQLEDHGTVRINLPITQEELAGWVGASRESIARALAALRRAGAVSTARREVTVSDLAQLRRMSV